jgi:small multidrug resistance pump
MSIQRAWAYLAIAVLAEVVATSALKASAGFTRPGPSLLVVSGYALAFYLMSLTLDTIPVGITYAVWSGVGIVLVTLVAWILYGQALDAPALLGLGLIVAGVAVLNLYSGSVAH